MRRAAGFEIHTVNTNAIHALWKADCLDRTFNMP
jgi:hypothetical protein